MHYAEKATSADPNYFMGYFARACAWDDKKDYNKAIEDYSKAIELNPDFADAYYKRGFVWQGKKEYDKAITEYDKAILNYSKDINIDSKNTESYFWRGVAFYHKADYNRAIEDYTKAIELNPNFADAYYNRGLALFAKKKYDEAIKDYNTVIDLDLEYADTYYFDRGNAWFAKKDYYKAIENYTEAIKKNFTYENAYYSRGLARKEQGVDLKGSIQDFEKYLELVIDKNDIWAKYAKYYIEEINEKIDDPDLSVIRELIDEVKDNLLIKEECVTHYTSLSVLKKLILKETKFRISEGNFMNDPYEGQAFFDFLEFRNKNITPFKNFSPKPFIGSFVSKDKNDDLNMWRFYGKEEGVEAKGCAITLSAQEFIEAINNFLTEEKEEARQEKEGDISFYRVTYLTNEATEFYIPDSDKSEDLKKLMTELKSKVNSYNGDNRTTLEIYLNNIAFLFKRDAYKNENEVRLVMKGIGFKKEYETDITPPRVYIDLVPIKKIVKKITLGPKVDKLNEWSSVFHYRYDENAPEIVISDLLYK